MGTALVRQNRSWMSLQNCWTPPCLPQAVWPSTLAMISIQRPLLELGPMLWNRIAPHTELAGFSSSGGCSSRLTPGEQEDRRLLRKLAERDRAPVFSAAWLDYLLCLDLLASKLFLWATREPVYSPRGLWSKLVIIIIETLVNCLIFSISYNNST